MKTTKPYAIHVEKIISCASFATEIDQFYRFATCVDALQFAQTIISENLEIDIEFSVALRRYEYDCEGYESIDQMTIYNNIQDETYRELSAMKYDMEC